MTVEDLVRKYGRQVRPNRGGYVLTCLYPEHRDSTPSFHVSHEGLFMCWGCGKKGNFATLLHDIAGWSWKKAIEHADLTVKTRPKNPLVGLQQEEETQTISKGLLGLFDVNWEEGYERYKLAVEREEEHMPPWAFPFVKGFLPETLRWFEAGYDDTSQRVTIPIFDKSKLKGFMGRTCIDAWPKYYIYPPLKPSNYLYNFSAVNTQQDIVLLVEGAWDVWMLLQKECPYPAISLMTSKVFTPQARLLASRNKTYVLLFDGDLGGRQGAGEVARTLIAMGCKIDVAMDYPRGVKDIKTLKREELLAVVAKRKPYPAPSAVAMLS